MNIKTLLKALGIIVAGGVVGDEILNNNQTNLNAGMPAQGIYQSIENEKNNDNDIVEILNENKDNAEAFFKNLGVLSKLESKYGEKGVDKLLMAYDILKDNKENFKISKAKSGLGYLKEISDLLSTSGRIVSDRNVAKNFLDFTGKDAYKNIDKFADTIKGFKETLVKLSNRISVEELEKLLSVKDDNDFKMDYIGELPSHVNSKLNSTTIKGILDNHNKIEFEEDDFYFKEFEKKILPTANVELYVKGNKAYLKKNDKVIEFSEKETKKLYDCLDKDLTSKRKGSRLELFGDGTELNDLPTDAKKMTWGDVFDSKSKEEIDLNNYDFTFEELEEKLRPKAKEAEFLYLRENVGGPIKAVYIKTDIGTYKVSNEKKKGEKSDVEKLFTCLRKEYNSEESEEMIEDLESEDNKTIVKALGTQIKTTRMNLTALSNDLDKQVKTAHDDLLKYSAAYFALHNAEDHNKLIRLADKLSMSFNDKDAYKIDNKKVSLFNYGDNKLDEIRNSKGVFSNVSLDNLQKNLSSKYVKDFVMRIQGLKNEKDKTAEQKKFDKDCLEGLTLDSVLNEVIYKLHRKECKKNPEMNEFKDFVVDTKADYAMIYDVFKLVNFAYQSLNPASKTMEKDVAAINAYLSNLFKVNQLQSMTELKRSGKGFKTGDRFEPSQKYILDNMVKDFKKFKGYHK